MLPKYEEMWWPAECLWVCPLSKKPFLQITTPPQEEPTQQPGPEEMLDAKILNQVD